MLSLQYEIADINMGKDKQLKMKSNTSKIEINIQYNIIPVILSYDCKYVFKFIENNKHNTTVIPLIYFFPFFIREKSISLKSFKKDIIFLIHTHLPLN